MHSAHFKELYSFSQTTQESPYRAVIFGKGGGVPLVVGCIDGTRIPIVASSSNEEIFVYRKNEHSINVQDISDSSLKFIDAVYEVAGKCI